MQKCMKNFAMVYFWLFRLVNFLTFTLKIVKFSFSRFFQLKFFQCHLETIFPLLMHNYGDVNQSKPEKTSQETKISTKSPQTKVEQCQNNTHKTNLCPFYAWYRVLQNQGGLLNQIFLKIDFKVNLVFAFFSDFDLWSYCVVIGIAEIWKIVKILWCDFFDFW